MKKFLVYVLFGSVWLLPVGVMGIERPDFNDPDAVLQDLRTKVDACSNAGERCSVACGYALKTVKNFLKANTMATTSPGAETRVL